MLKTLLIRDRLFKIYEKYLIKFRKDSKRLYYKCTVSFVGKDLKVSNKYISLFSYVVGSLKQSVSEFKLPELFNKICTVT